MPTSNPGLFLVLRYRDAPAALDFLPAALGFTVAAAYRGDDPARIEHAQLRWPQGGGVMLGSGTDDDHVGQGQAYLVVPTDDDVDALHAQALDSGFRTVREPTDMDYGGRGSTLADPEGNQWSLGSYRGE